MGRECPGRGDDLVRRTRRITWQDGTDHLRSGTLRQDGSRRQRPAQQAVVVGVARIARFVRRSHAVVFLRGPEVNRAGHVSRTRHHRVVAVKRVGRRYQPRCQQVGQGQNGPGAPQQG